MNARSFTLRTLLRDWRPYINNNNMSFHTPTASSKGILPLSRCITTRELDSSPKELRTRQKWPHETLNHLHMHQGSSLLPWLLSHHEPNQPNLGPRTRSLLTCAINTLIAIRSSSILTPHWPVDGLSV